jgi:hypothetical protein
MDIKLFLAIIASIITVLAYIPYFKDVFKGKTKPHIYTWIVWAITQGTASAAIIYGGGNFGAISTTIGTLLVIVICLLSIKYGTKHITRNDTIVLIFALLAIVVWWMLDSPLLAVIMITLIDGLGYLPTFRKTYKEPNSETLSFWVAMTVVTVITIIANAEYNILTVAYLTVLAIANTAEAIIIIWRRKMIK